MYYPDEFIEELRSRANIVDVIGNYVSLKKRGANYFGLCPFHGEKTPSFSVAPGKQIFYCFGCGKGGDVLKFLMEYENISFQEAVQRLASELNVPLPELSDTGAGRAERDRRMRLLELNRDAAVFFYAALRSDKGGPGLSYLKKRGIRGETIVHWGLGYADQRRDSLYRYLKGKGYEDELLRDSGLFRFSERGVSDRFFQRVIFPILDVNMRVIGFGGRVIGEGEPKYLNSPETELFDKSRNLFGLNFAKRSRQKQMILCEGYMDVISMHQAGFSNAVASLGTSLTERQAALLKRYVSELVLSYDSDNAGVKAAKRAIPILREAGVEPKLLDLRPYKDPDELIRTKGPDGLRERLSKARNAFLWEVETEKGNYDLQDPAGQNAYYQAVGKLLSASFSDPLERESYIRAVAREQLIDYDLLRQLVERRAGEQSPLLNPPRGGDSREQRRSGRRAESREQRTERQLIAWLSEKPDMIPIAEKHIRPSELSDEICREIFPLLCQRLPASRILDRFRGDEGRYERAASLLSGDPVGTESDEKALLKGLEDIIRSIRLRRLNEEIERESDGERLTELFREQSALQSFRLS